MIKRILLLLIISLTLNANELSYTIKDNIKKNPPKVNLSGFSKSIDNYKKSKKNKKITINKKMISNQNKLKTKFNKIKECENKAKTKEEKNLCWESKTSKNFYSKNKINSIDSNYEEIINKAQKNYKPFNMNSFQRKQSNAISDKDINNIYKNKHYKMSQSQFDKIKNYKLK
jgi:hypothetical protein